MSYRIAKTFGFEAAHRLADLPDGHKCARPHGHSYTVEVVLAADELTPPGFVVDFACLDELRSYVNSQFDHRDLDELWPRASTSENLARHFFDWTAKHLDLPDEVTVVEVSVAETAATRATYRPGEAP